MVIISKVTRARSRTIDTTAAEIIPNRRKTIMIQLATRAPRPQKCRKVGREYINATSWNWFFDE